MKKNKNAENIFLFTYELINKFILILKTRSFER
jgi:hypothetical protein